MAIVPGSIVFFVREILLLSEGGGCRGRVLCSTTLPATECLGKVGLSGLPVLFSKVILFGMLSR